MPKESFFYIQSYFLYSRYLNNQNILILIFYTKLIFKSDKN